MTGRERDAADWMLAVLTAAVWSGTYVLFAIRDDEIRAKLRLLAWRVRQRLRLTRSPRPVPPSLMRPAPVLRTPPPRRIAPPAPSRRTSAATALAEPEPVRIAEWRANHLPLRYRLLGQVRRGANDN